MELSPTHQKAVDNIHSGKYDELFLAFSNLGLCIDKNLLCDVLYKQDQKGIEKYGHTLNDCPTNKFNWNLMAIEEIADCLVYIIKSISNK